MGTVNFSGAGTGIDWSQIIDSEIALRRSRTITPLENWKDTWETQISTFDEFRKNISDLRTATTAMDSPDELRSYGVQSSSATTVEASVSGSPTPGTSTVLVNQLAQAALETHSGVDADATVVNNSGSTQYFAYSYGGAHVTLEVASGTTLQELAGLINHDPTNPGVTASILDDGIGGATSHHLVLRGNDTGAVHTIAIDAAGTTLAGDWSSLAADAAAGSSSVSVNDASPFHQYQAVVIGDDDSPAEYQIIDSIASNTLNLRGTLASDFTVAQNAYATPRGIGSGLAGAVGSGATQITVSDASHFQVGKHVIIADAGNSEELTISAVDTATNAVTFSTALTNGYAADGYVTQLEGGRKFTFEDTDFTQVQAAQNAQVRLDGYPPTSWIERASNIIADLIPGVTLKLHGATSGTPVTITVNADAAAVKQKITAFVDAYNKVKTFLNQQTSYDSTTKKAGALLGNYAAQIVESALREIVSGPAPGFLDGTDPYTLLAQVGLDTLGQTDDESSLGTIKIDEAKLDAALAEDFDGVIQLFAGSFSGYSDSRYITFYQASATLTKPGIYSVQADFDGSGTLTAGRMKLSSESSYRPATLDPPYISGDSGNPEYGLLVKAVWDGSSSTQTATVRVTQGIAGKLADTLSGFLDDTSGLLHNIDQSYKDIVGQIDKRIAQEQERLDLLKTRLVTQYAKLEQLLVQLQGQQSWASSLASSMQQSG
jgi:flagellar capping protein FliD